jgi:NAD(P)-dependent dehydrogenase (short-subunit alcohol dehydrogenase family)
MISERCDAFNENSHAQEEKLNDIAYAAGSSRHWRGNRPWARGRATSGPRRLSGCGAGLDREEELPANIEFRRFDVTDERASEQLAEEFPEIDALVNAAGVILHDNQEFSSDGFRKVMDINLGGTQLVTYAFKDALLKRKGAVVNFASLWSVFGSSKNPAYSASKGAVMQFTKALAVAWAPQGVRVNAVAPGWMVTCMTISPRSMPERYGAITPRIPMGRWG